MLSCRDRRCRTAGRRDRALSVVAAIDGERGFILGVDIAAIDRHAAFAVDADEYTGAGDLGWVVDDRTIVEGGKRRFDLANTLVNFLRVLFCLGIFRFECLIFCGEGVEGRLFFIAQGVVVPISRRRPWPYP